MKTIKKLGLVVGLAGCLFSASEKVEAQSAVFTTNFNANTTNVIFTNAVYISQIQLQAGTLTNPVQINFYDYTNASLLFTNTNTWYTRSNYLTNITDVITNGVGAVQTNIYPGIYDYVGTNLGSTNTAQLMTTMGVASGAQNLRNTRLITVKGLTVGPAPGFNYGTSNVTLTIFYSNPF